MGNPLAAMECLLSKPRSSGPSRSAPTPKEEDPDQEDGHTRNHDRKPLVAAGREIGKDAMREAYDEQQDTAELLAPPGDDERHSRSDDQGEQNRPFPVQSPPIFKARHNGYQEPKTHDDRAQDAGEASNAASSTLGSFYRAFHDSSLLQQSADRDWVLLYLHNPPQSL